VNRTPEIVSWITWVEINTVVARQLSSMKIEDPSLRDTVKRLAKAVSRTPDMVRRFTQSEQAANAAALAEPNCIAAGQRLAG